MRVRQLRRGPAPRRRASCLALTSGQHSLTGEELLPETPTPASDTFVGGRDAVTASGFLSFPSAAVHYFSSDFGWAIMWVDSQTSLYESRVFTVIDRKKRMEQFEEVSQAVEPEKPSSKSWLYIFGAVILIFGLTFIFQQMSGTSNGEVRPADIESLQAEVNELKGAISDLEARIDDLENE